MTLLVIRHGSSVGNEVHRFLGWSEAELDEQGVAQARAVADRLAEAGVTRVLSSDLVRAVQTARPLAELLSLPLETDPRLREISNGQWTELTPTEIQAGWPDLWAAYVAGEDVARPGGERWADVKRRLREALGELGVAEGTMALFTHSGPVIIAAAETLGVELPGNIFRGALAAPANGSITTIAGGRLLGYADIGHLQPVPRLDVPYQPVGPS